MAAASGASRPSVDVGALRGFLESIRSYNPDLIFGLGSGQPLYHYTDLGGLRGILQDDDLWLTHSRYSNDEEEMTHGYRAAKEIVAEACTDTSDSDRLTYLECLAKLLEKPATAGVYICCFCQEDNLLSQWRGYGANGAGVSLQINPGSFSSVTGPDSPHGGLMRLWKVFYESDRQRRILRSAIDFAFVHPWTPSSSPQDRARQAADAIEFFIPTFKNQDFAEEQEWRLIFTPPPNCPVKPQFRIGRGMLIPYYSLKKLSGEIPSPTRRVPLTGVRIGPNAQKWLNLDSTQMLVTQAGYSDIKVESSDTPFRG